MKKILLLLVATVLAIGASAQQLDVTRDTVYTVHSIDQNDFREVIADWDAQDWKMISPRPVVVDFYADWCMPCRRLAPILQEIAQHYQGKVDFYRINVDENPDIAACFEVRSIPMLLICPLESDPKTIVGLYPKEEYIRVFNQALFK